MTDDIVKRLRYGLIDTNTSYRYQQEAADEIEKLRKKYELALSTITFQAKEIERAVDEIEMLQAALKPFVKTLEWNCTDADPDDYWIDHSGTLSVGDLRAAKAALGESDE